MIAVEYTLTQAQAVLAKMDGEHTMSPRELAEAAAARTKILQGIRVEIGTGGNAEVVRDPSGQNLQGAAQ